MSIKLHAKCVKRLKETLPGHLENLTVKNNTYLNQGSITDLYELEKILPESGQAQKELFHYIGENPLSSFLIDTLNKELFEKNEYEPDASLKPLKEYNDYADLVATSSRLIDMFTSLPWDYEISFQFNKSYGKVIADYLGNYEIYHDMQVVVPDDDRDTEYPLATGIKNRDLMLFRNDSHILSALSKKPDKWEKDTSYLQYKIQGYIGIFQNTRTLQRAVFILKAFFGLTMVNRLFHIRHSYPKISFAHRLIIHKNQNDRREIISTEELPDDLAYGLSNINLNFNEKKLNDMIVPYIFKDHMGKIAPIFQNQSKSEKLLLAANWFLDANTSRNELLAYVQAIVVLEILLGDKATSDIIGLGELLSNRCAYFISRDSDEREQILEKFKQIYSTRSEIVHSGKSELNRTEKESFFYLLELCARVIQQEQNTNYDPYANL